MCDWVGVVANPGFITNTLWTPYGPAVIDPTNAGDLDPGVGEILDATCGNYGGFTQQVTMPRLSVSEPLVAVTTFQVPNGEGEDFVTANAGTAIAGNYENGTPIFGNGVWTTERQCLGQAAYAPESTNSIGVPLTLGTYINEGDCQASATVLIDHMDIEPAMPNECPTFGLVLDGDAEGSGGWTFSASAENGVADGTVAQITAGDGESGTHGVQLDSPEGCDFSSGTTTMSVPIAASPTFSIWHTTSSSSLAVEIDGLQLGLTGNGGTTDTYCLPPYQVGGVYTVLAQNETDGTCGAKDGVNAVLDNLTVATDSACGSDPAIADPGFESGHSLFGASNSNSNGIVESIQDTGAHGGARDLLFEVTTVCGGASWEAAEVTPAAQGSDGPGLSFWYKFPAGGTAELFATVYKGSFTAVRDGLWHQAVACIDPERVGQPAFTDFELFDETDGVTCGTGVTQQEIAYLDDLAVVTDPSCPTQ
jgi:hypothetical protein